jgi:hypothetical protein
MHTYIHTYLCQRQHVGDCFFIAARVLLKVLGHQSAFPVLTVDIQQHLALQVILTVINVERIVVAVQPVDQGLDGRTVQMPDVRSRLARFLAHHG